ncbi:MAG: DegV family protein, partial [Coriobacteriia bacterium]
MSVRVVVDSTSYIPHSLRDELEMHVVSLAVVFPEGAQRELDVNDREFYRRLSSEQKVPTSTQPTPAEMEEAFLAVLDEGHEVVGVFISSDMSGTFSSAELAARGIRESRPDAVIELVDSRSNSMQLGMAALSAARAARDGGDAAACAAAARDTMLRTRFLFTPHTLDYLRLGGRIGAASAFLGAMLQIRPILTVEHGIVEPFDKVRTRRRALERIVEQFSEDVEQSG